MNTMKFLLPALAIFALSLGPVDGDKVCKDAVGALTKKQLKGVSECTSQMKFKNAKERSAKMTCVMKCVLQREGIIAPDGYADAIGALRFITLNLPDHVQTWARSVMMTCQEASATLDPNEDSCKSYDPLVKCALASLNLFCNPK